MTGVGGVIKNPDSTRKSEDGSLNKIETLVYCVYRDSCWPFNSLTNSTDTKIQRVKPTASSCLFASVCILVRSVVLHVKIYLDQALTSHDRVSAGPWLDIQDDVTLYVPSGRTSRKRAIKNQQTEFNFPLLL